MKHGVLTKDTVCVFLNYGFLRVCAESRIRWPQLKEQKTSIGEDVQETGTLGFVLLVRM